MTTKQTKLSQLLATAEAIERDALPVELDMEVYGFGEACITAACLAGNYALMFPGAGLTLEPPPRGGRYWYLEDTDGDYGSDALKKHFDFMNPEDVDGLFDQKQYDERPVPPSVVVARVRAVVAKYQEGI